MKKLLLCTAALSASMVAGAAVNQLKVNQIGYLEDDIKAAVYMGDTPIEDINFVLIGPDGLTAVDSVVSVKPWEPKKYSARIYFSSRGRTPGSAGNYTLAMEDVGGTILDKAPIYIGNDAYSRVKMNEMPLYYLRQQRCGYNPAPQAE